MIQLLIDKLFTCYSNLNMDFIAMASSDLSTYLERRVTKVYFFIMLII